MIRFDIRESVGEHFTAMMNTELTHFLGKALYKCGEEDINHRNCSYCRNFTVKGVGQGEVEVSRDRKGEFTTQVMPGRKQYVADISRNVSPMFLA